MTNLTEAEAWEALADVLEGYGMPPITRHESSLGLCSSISLMCGDGAITRATARRMHARIKAHMRPGQYWLAPKRRAAPRVRWCRRFAEEARRERGR